MSYEQSWLDDSHLRHPSVITGDTAEASRQTAGLVANRTAQGLLSVATEISAYRGGETSVAKILRSLAEQLMDKAQTDKSIIQAAVKLRNNWELCDDLATTLAGVYLAAPRYLADLTGLEAKPPAALGSNGQRMPIALVPELPAGQGNDKQVERIKQLRRLAATGIAQALVIPPSGEDPSAFVVPLASHAAATFVFTGGEQYQPETLSVTAYQPYTSSAAA